jgi:hypothetical protein
MKSSRWIGVWPLALGLVLVGAFTPQTLQHLSVLGAAEQRGQANGACYQYDFQQNGMYRRYAFPWYCTVTLEDGQVITAVTATPRFNHLPKDGERTRVRQREDVWILTTGILPEIRLTIREVLPMAFGLFLTYLGGAALRSTPPQTSPTPGTATKKKLPSDPRSKK